LRASPILLLVAGALSAVACSPLPDDNTNGGLVNTSWTVVSIAGAPTLADARPTLTFAPDGTVSGSAGCNRYSGPFRTDGGAIAIGEVASTLMGCDGDRNAQEIAFLDALRGAAMWRLADDGNLVLNGAGEIVAGPGVAEGPPGDAPIEDLGGTRWNLSEMGGTADFARLVPTLEFGADGTVSGFAGCNTFTGPYTLAGDDLTLGPLATTRIRCQRPASAVEAEYLSALAGVSAWSIGEAGTLTLGGAVPMTFTRN